MRWFLLLAATLAIYSVSGEARSQESTKTMADVIAEASASDWRTPEPVMTLYLTLQGGTVVIELAPEFAPDTVANIQRLVKARYFDGLSINRVQENYVVQLGDPQAEDNAARPHGLADRLEPEFFRPRSGLSFVELASEDPYADTVGFAGGFPMGADTERAWLTHCYAMVGVGRDVPPDSGIGTELYIVTGHAPRHLDRNVTLVGRVLQGMELLTTLPRGTGALGFYEQESERIPIESVRLASEVPRGERVGLRVLRTDTRTFQELIKSRQFRTENWFVDPAGRIGVCNVPIPVSGR